MSCKVIIGGHSQVPHFIPPVQDTEIKICKVNGGKLKDFWEHPRFRVMREGEHDLAILFLGGNDIYDGCSPRELVNETLQIIDHLQQLNKRVAVTLLEPRHYSNNNRFGVSPNTYNKVSKAINKALLKNLNKRNIRTINLGAKPFAAGHTPDGVHFESLTRLHISSKLRNCIKHHFNKAA